MTQSVAIALISGGLDSMVSAARAKEDGHRLFALSFDYDQRHQVELAAARRIAAILGVERHVVMPLDLRAFGGSALTAEIDVPKDGVGTDIPVTYVPARNTIFLSLALGWAEAAGARDIYIGVNALDYSGYPDCRPEFIAAFEGLAELATKAGVEGDPAFEGLAELATKAGVEGEPFRIQAPLQMMTKADIVREGTRLGLDLGLSWSCYDPTPAGEHCGECDSCRLRSRGFDEAGIADPTRYAVKPA
ncbi:MAG: 7-cyano-7-deazaguanine synthase QueC [Sphingomonas sp.]|nr:MAG: 7-cyano-7-deazaguanine synthase QueC [Sphingomonas sp.]